MSHKVAQAANRLLPVLLLVWGFPFVLYLLLAKLGQAEDLMRTVHESLVANFFLSMILGLLAVSSWSIFLMVFTELGGTTPSSRLWIASALAAVGPGLIAGYQTFHFGGQMPIAEVLLIVPFAGALVMMPWQVSQSYQAKVEKFCIYSCLAVSLFAYGVLFFSPDYWGLLLGPVTVLVVVLLCGMWLVWFSFRLPALGVVLLLAGIAAALSGHFGSRPVREIPAQTRPRFTPEQNADGWLAARQSEIDASSSYPVYLITSDGGGIRAAYWTATLLGAFADRDPHFLEHVYLLSGVSGGSVGSAVFAALAADPSRAKQTGGFQAGAKAALAWDFLAAPLARMVTRDPFDSVFTAKPSADRGEALERIFEGGWSMTAGSRSLSEPLENLWAGERQWRVPSLLLNVTKADTGQHRIVSNLRLEPPFLEGTDVLTGMAAGSTLRLSTAALLSARFPLIGVQGEMTLRGARERLVDGGYFDNSGGAAAKPILDKFLEQAEKRGVRGKIVPIGLILTNDPERVARNPEVHWMYCAPPAAVAESNAGLADVLAAPLGTLDAGRSNAAERWRQEFRTALENAGGKAQELGLFQCKEADPVGFPLGWSLSEKARTRIDQRAKLIRLP